VIEVKLQGMICIVDDDPDVRDSVGALLRSTGYQVKTFAGPDAFLCDAEADATSCLILDVRLGDANGLDFQQELIESEFPVPVILMSGYGDIPMTVRAMRAGAVTFLSKPFEEEELLTAVEEALTRDAQRRERQQQDDSLRSRLEGLTPRERDVLGLVAAGLMNKQIAAHLQLSEITVKIHRGNMMRKMQADSLADLVRMAEALGIRETVSRYGR
jgi:FixJ family two-component response regulator